MTPFVRGGLMDAAAGAALITTDLVIFAVFLFFAVIP